MTNNHADIIKAVQKALHEAPIVFLAPVTPRLWRFAGCRLRNAGWPQAICAFFLEGTDLLVEGRLDRRGRVRRARTSSADRKRGS